jgi:cytoskeletal protein CcmA (bactofilin family)
VTCFRCGYDYAFIPEDPLVPCPRCGELIDFRDHEVAGFYGKRVRTVGDVVVHPGGSLVGVPVTCENLTVNGEISGPVHCTGTAEFLAPCRVTGAVNCGRLVIGEGADVLFLQPVRTAKLEVHGHVLAEIDCAGRASITSRGVLDGSIVAGGLDIEPGGSLLAVASIRAGNA